MDTLPTEVLGLIFEAASCDGGRTASSVRAACTAFCAASESSRFRSVAITESPKTLSFREALQKASPSARASIRHLFVVVQDEDMAATVDDVLQLTAPCLECLTCICLSSCSTLHARLLATAFPRLHALSLCCVDMSYPPDDRSDLFPGASASPLFPCLQYLHIAYARSGYMHSAHIALCRFITRTGGLLTRVRLSGGVVFRRDGLCSMAAFRKMLLFPAHQLVESPPLPWPALSPIRTYVVGAFFLGTTSRWKLTSLERETREQKDAVRLVLLPRRAIVPWPQWREKWLSVQAGELDPLYEWPEQSAPEILAEDYPVWAGDI
ncbi:hypothetical protein GLOTRDRAFT_90572 [Gloeophyllum trabeum ATCC 11539]|uniref:F-box domain-containing protein n=1 Tax=Gloeophyllum trabeum (strain ATCC 11539 / FP-39264 / Madison 617) TaxID=670483 RepID=S7QFX8_GLOTA|nr:uncharacterized protein GLOTRDRAFT_90572 [Gloeophyllum trabeum ATCC 11539]EPQ58776.1 hypothetical protein GLOTRDRAFT_90572 [Gloeophyllum trabeum ATCC 11539]